MFNKGPLSCKVLAVAMYFFYMSSFFWMMIIAFDVCKTLKMATTQLRLTTGSQWRKFSLYSTVAWGLPVAFVTVVTILDHVEAMPEAFKPGNCQIDNSKQQKTLFWFRSDTETQNGLYFWADTVTSRNHILKEQKFRHRYRCRNWTLVLVPETRF